MTNVWQQLVRRLKYLREFVRTKTAQGFEFENIPDFKLDRELKQSPKDVKKALKEARKWSAEKLYKSSTYTGEYSYGETVEGTEVRRLKREYKKNEEYVPTLTITNWLRDQIATLPSVRYFKESGYVDLTPDKERLLSIISDIEANISTRNQEQSVEEYFKQREAEIVDAIATITYDSKQARVEYALKTKLAVILLGRPLTIEEAESFSEYEDESEEEIDITGAADYFKSVVANPYFKL